jgi:hypothetical protein
MSGPVGNGNYEVQQGDCIESIAHAHGFFWQTIWNHPNNLDLKNARKNPNVLQEGDRVFVPDLRPKQESGATDKRHKFKRKGVPSKLRLVLMDDDQPRANAEYKLEIDGTWSSGRTDADGVIEHRIPPNAQRGKLIIGTEGEEYELKLGNMDPVSEITGVQSRLNNLGFGCAITGQLDKQTRNAILAFQAKHGIPGTGQPDAVTQQQLKKVHES